MKRLILVGAGDFGREIYNWCLDIKNTDWQVAGFIDDNLHALDGFGLPCKILGTIRDYTPASDDVLVCTIGNSSVRLKISRELAAKGANFINLIHSTSVVSPFAKLGVGIIAGPHSYIASHAQLADFVMLNVCSTVGHDAVIGSACTLSSHCDITGKVKFGACVFMGSHATIIPGLTVGDNVIIGAGSAVMRNMPANITVFGVPAKKLL